VFTSGNFMLATAEKDEIESIRKRYDKVFVDAAITASEPLHLESISQYQPHANTE
jgi:hypothetical protein